MSIVSTQERHGVQQTALPTELGIESAADELSTLTLPSAHVLVAEDNLANQEVARLMLKGLGCQSTVVADGHEAVKAFCSGSYDVILMDCQMPVMDGYQATTAIRNHEYKSGATERIPILALSADAVEGADERCVAAGMDDYLSKPFTVQQLFEILSRWLLEETSAPMDVLAGTDIKEATTDVAAVEVLDQLALNNIRQVQKMTGSNVLEHLINIYFTEAPVLVDTLCEAYNKNDSHCVAKTAHRLKSSSSNIGAKRLAALFGTLEAKAKENQLKPVEPLMVLLEAEYQLVRQALTLELRGHSE